MPLHYEIEIVLEKRRKKRKDARLAGRVALQHALAIKQQQLGSEHTNTALSLNDLALHYEGQKRYTEADPLYKHDLAIYVQWLGTTYPHTLQVRENFANLLRTMGQDPEAKQLEEDS